MTGARSSIRTALDRTVLVRCALTALFVGTIFKGNHFHVDRSARVKSGSAKGLWHHGTRIATGSKGTYKTTGWVKASAFCS